ncbi:MAG: uracil-DNA glycosylase [Micrococcales bacterium]|nr:uracil-DNA glycosylase [Micrococcales bacterium]
MFFEQMHSGWQALLAEQKAVLETLEPLVEGSLPPKDLVMRAFKADPRTVRVVILGQDPYPTPGDAIGLAFAVSKTNALPRSLKNIIAELESDLGMTVSKYPDLSQWENRGVMLLNSSLTTIPHGPGSHSKLGWQQFTFLALERLAGLHPYVVLAWGNHAQKIAGGLPKEVLVISSAHPSPLSASRGFFGSKPFSKANAALGELGQEPIDWSL